MLLFLILKLYRLFFILSKGKLIVDVLFTITNSASEAYQVFINNYAVVEPPQGLFY